MTEAADTAVQKMQRMVHSLALDSELMNVNLGEGNFSFFKTPSQLNTLLAKKMKDLGELPGPTITHRSVYGVNLGEINMAISRCKERIQEHRERKENKISTNMNHTVGRFYKHFLENMNDQESRSKIIDEYIRVNGDISIISGIQNRSNLLSKASTSEYRDSLTSWDRNKRIIASNAEMNVNVKKFTDSLLTYKPVAYASDKGNPDSKIKFMKVVEEYVKHQTSENQTIGLNGLINISDVEQQVRYCSEYICSVRSRKNTEQLARSLKERSSDAQFKNMVDFLLSQISVIDTSMIRISNNPDELTISVNQMMVNSTLKYLEDEFMEQVEKEGKISHVNFMNTAAEKLEKINGYIEKCVFSMSFYEENYIEKDKGGTAIWALIFYALRCGQHKIIERIFEHYDGTLRSEVVDLSILYRAFRDSNHEDKNTMIQMSEAVSEKIIGQMKIDVFKKLLYIILSKSASPSICDLAESFQQNLANTIWLNLMMATYDDLINSDYEQNAGGFMSYENMLVDLQSRMLSTRNIDLNY